jgi:hypothetical protein
VCRSQAHLTRLACDPIAEDPRLASGVADTEVGTCPVGIQTGGGFFGHAKIVPVIIRLAQCPPKFPPTKRPTNRSRNVPNGGECRQRESPENTKIISGLPNRGQRERIMCWRRRRDSNPRYAFGAYNGLANRRLQPLGHVSASWKAYNVRTAGSNSRLISVRRPILNDIEGSTADEPKTTPRHA